MFMDVFDSTHQRRRRWICRQLSQASRPNRGKSWSLLTTGRSSTSRTAKTSMWRCLSWPGWLKKVSKQKIGNRWWFLFRLALIPPQRDLKWKLPSSPYPTVHPWFELLRCTQRVHKCDFSCSFKIQASAVKYTMIYPPVYQADIGLLFGLHVEPQPFLTAKPLNISIIYPYFE